MIIISQCIHISKYHLVYLRDKQCLFVNYTSIKPGKISAFQLHNSHWWCLQDLSLGKDVDLSLYPVFSLVPKLVLVIQFPLPVIETTHPLEMGLGHIFCHFSHQNAYSQSKRHTGRNFLSSCWLLWSRHETPGTLASILCLWDIMLRAMQVVWKDEENFGLKLS